MRILVVGGGSGGHVIPVVAVITALKARHPRAEIRFWCDRKFSATTRSVVEKNGLKVPVSTIVSGKLRRYNGVSLIDQLKDFETVSRNILDALKVVVGVLQSFVMLVLWRPDVIFTKGGFVCLPVGLAAAALRIPLVIHDSDAHPGLTNRVLSRFATSIATGSPLEYYSYPKDISHYVGIPISDEFEALAAADARDLKTEVGTNPDRPLVVITGGGLGAKRINDTTVHTIGSLMEIADIILITGDAAYEEVRHSLPGDARLKVFPFIATGMPRMMAAADLVVSRAGATTMLELAALEKPIILVPNALLTGGHQLKNAKVYEEAKAAVLLDEEAMMANPSLLPRTIAGILENEQIKQKLSSNIKLFARPNAAEDMADLILAARRGTRP